MSFEPPPCDELTTSDPFRRATRVRPPGVTTVFSPQDVGPQVDVAPLKAVVAPRRGAGKHDGLLCDKIARVCGNLCPKVCDLLFGRSRA